MCTIILGRRRCAICDLIINDNVKLPVDARYRECEQVNKVHKQKTYINYLAFVCACCKESARAHMTRRKGLIGTRMNPEVEEFVPESERMGRNIIWIGKWWVEQ